MQYPRVPLSDEFPIHKNRKRKAANQKTNDVKAFEEMQGSLQYPRMPLSDEIPINKMRKKKIVNPDEIQIQKSRKKAVKPKGSLLDLERNDFKAAEEMQGSLQLKAANKISKRTSRNSPFPDQPERSNSDSFPDTSTSGNEYRALRHRYLLLEEESFAVGRNLREVEVEVQTLEDEKLALLDQLLVLEGLIDPSELQSQGKF